jgi:hypothetical protein
MQKRNERMKNILGWFKDQKLPSDVKWSVGQTRKEIGNSGKEKRHTGKDEERERERDRKGERKRGER